MEEGSFEVEWSQILCSLVGFTKTKYLTLSVTTYYNTHFHSIVRGYLF